MKTTTKAWEKIFQQKGAFLKDAHPDMDAVIQTLQKMNAKTVLDLGCGSGRHVVHLAKHGFSVYGLDNSPSGLDIAKQWVAGENLKADLVRQEMTNPLPWRNEFFDAVISTAVIHHADSQTIKRIIFEIERVLKQDGLFFVQVPKLKNQATKYKQIELNTYVPLDGDEKGLPHHYFTPEELEDFFSNFNITDIHLDEWSHYCMTAVKR